MLSIPGKPGATCDGMSRRELLRVGGAGLLGVSLANLLRFEAARAADGVTGAPAGDAPHGKQTGFGTAKNFIFVFLQGGPSHLDIWDPKPDCAGEHPRDLQADPDEAIKGEYVTEVMPNLAKVLDKTTLIRSVSYTPAGLFNHTAAIYQMMTGYTPDKVCAVGPAGAAEPQRLPVHRGAAGADQTAGRADAAVRHAAAPAPGVRRHRQGGHGRVPRGGQRPVLPLPGPGAEPQHAGPGPPPGDHGRAHAAAGDAPAEGRRADARDREGRQRLRPRRLRQEGPRTGHQRPGARRST